MMNDKEITAINNIIEICKDNINNALDSQYTEVRNKNIFISDNLLSDYDTSWSILIQLASISELASDILNQLQNKEKAMENG